MSYLLVLAIVFSPERNIVNEICKYYESRDPVYVVAKMKIEHLYFAQSVGIRQYWEPAKSDRHLVGMLVANACPEHWPYDRRLQWALWYYRKLNFIKGAK